MTLPQVRALAQYWQVHPPAAMQLARIAAALGLRPPKAPASPASAPTTVDDAMDQASAAGLPVMRGRPNDPMLDLIGL